MHYLSQQQQLLFLLVVVQVLTGAVTTVQAFPRKTAGTITPRQYTRKIRLQPSSSPQVSSSVSTYHFYHSYSSVSTQLLAAKNPNDSPPPPSPPLLKKQRQQPPPAQIIPSPLSFLTQAGLCTALYLFHLVILTQHQLVLPYEILGLAAIGYDSLAGMAVLLAYYTYYHSSRRRKGVVSSRSSSSPPWKLPVDSTDNNNSDDEDADSKVSRRRRLNWQLIRFRTTFLLTAFALVTAYFQTGKFSLFWEDLLFEASAAGWPLTVALTRSCQVLLGHLSWVLAGCTILAFLPRPPPFFRIMRRRSRRRHYSRPSGNDDDYWWFQISKSSSNWVWWTIGGYFVSSWFFNMADCINKLVLPAEVLQNAAESVVTQLVNPEHNDIAASIVGYVAPCLSAPVWEEVLYRGFVLAGLTATTGSYSLSCALQAILFSAHHMSVTAALPLTVLGWTWAVLYTKSRNLLTVIIVHAMWNSRVFLGSWFGL